MPMKQRSRDLNSGKYTEKALSAAMVRNIAEPGMYADGNCLYLIVEESGAKHWICEESGELVMLLNVS